MPLGQPGQIHLRAHPGFTDQFHHRLEEVDEEA